MKIVLFLYFLAAGVTWVAGDVGQGIAGRLATADLLMLGLGAYLLTRPRQIRISALGASAILLLVTFGFGLANSGQPARSVVEWLVHAFAVAGFVVLYSLIARLPLKERLEVATLWVRAATCLALFGLYEIIGGELGAPSILDAIGRPPITRTGLVGTFRNTGQAGFFFAVALVTALPVQRVARDRARIEMLVCVILLSLAVTLTVKRSAILGLGAGWVLLFLMDRSRSSLIHHARVAAWVTVVVVPTFLWMLHSSELFRGRIVYKLGPGSTQIVENFARQNLRAAGKAFAAHPVIGVGLDGVRDVWGTRYELHSTYLAVPVQTGVVGTLAYLCFVLLLFAACTRPANDDPRTAAMARMYLPLLLGLAISVAYTYQLRKREFWITVAVASALMAPQATRSPTRERALPEEDQAAPSGGAPAGSAPPLPRSPVGGG